MPTADTAAAPVILRYVGMARLEEDIEMERSMDAAEADLSGQPGDEKPPSGGSGGHGRWMMVACCVPMLAIAVLVVLSGAGFGFLVVAVMCTAMMALMMGAMSGGGRD